MTNAKITKETLADAIKFVDAIGTSATCEMSSEELKEFNTNLREAVIDMSCRTAMVNYNLSEVQKYVDARYSDPEADYESEEDCVDSCVEWVAGNMVQTAISIYSDVAGFVNDRSAINLNYVAERAVDQVLKHLMDEKTEARKELAVQAESEPEKIVVKDEEITEEILELACKMAEKDDFVTMKYAQGAHALHEGKSLIEICHVDFFDDKCMREDMLEHINDSLNYNGSSCHDGCAERARKHYNEDKTYCLGLQLFDYILIRSLVWTDWYYARTSEFREPMDMA